MVTRPLLVVLLIAALVLPIAICVLVATSGLMASLHDETASVVLVRVAQAGGVLWLLTLIVLLISLGVNSIAADLPAERDESDSDTPA